MPDETPTEETPTNVEVPPIMDYEPETLEPIREDEGIPTSPPNPENPFDGPQYPTPGEIAD